MNLSELYSINVRYQRSTRIDSDLDESFFPGLVFHGTAEQTLKTITDQYQQAKQSTFTVTGPYGSGKSTIALILCGLLHPNHQIRFAAEQVIGGKEASESFHEVFGLSGKNDGWLIIRTVGGVGNPVDVIWNGVVSALKEHPKTKRSKLIKKRPPQSDTELLAYIDELLTDVDKRVDGVLFVLDEMGKLLEHISRKSGDLHVFQDLAEKLSRASETNLPCLFVGLLHQAISEYAAGLGTAIQNEWGKVQGRYSDVPYLVSTDETIALIQKSIVCKDSAVLEKNIRDFENKATRVLEAVGGSTLKSTSPVRDRLSACYPLHPATTIILGPLSKRRFSQNERSTFSFLNSREPLSFQQFLSNHGVHETYRLPQLWDYLEANLEHLIISSPDGHAWSLAEDALVRASKLEGVTTCHINILKSTALLNLFGRKNGFYATEKLLFVALDQYPEQQILEGLETLRNGSLLTKRKHLSAWAIFEGADIDVSELLEEKIEQLATDDSWIDNLDYSNFTIAKRHYHQSGVLRWMGQRILKNINYLNDKDLIARKDGSFASFVMIAESSQQEQTASYLKGLSVQHYQHRQALAVCPNLDIIQRNAVELYALQQLERELPELQSDKIAQKEHEVRLIEAQKALKDTYEKAFNTAEWWFNGRNYNPQPLSIIASDIAEGLYDQCPPIFNELVGRSKLSGTSVSARKKLMVRMIEDSTERNLGIKGFPPEMAIYLTCLKNLGLHTPQVNGGFGFRTPMSGEIKDVMWAAEDFLKQNNQGVVTLEELFALWQEPPFGLAAGIVPILALALLLSKDDSLAYYDKDSTNKFVYIPDPDEAFVTKMLKSPKDVGIRHFEVQGIKRQYINSLAKLAGQHFDREVPAAALAVARPIVTFMHKLPQWTKVTKKLTKRTRQFRDLVLKADDPYKLLLEDFVVHFGLEGIDDKSRDAALQEQLSAALDELKAKHNELLNGFRQILIEQLGMLDENLVEQCRKVKGVAADYRLQAFSQRLSQCQSASDSWLVNIITLVGSTPERNWNDVTLAKAREETHDYCQRFKRMSLFASQDGILDANQKSIALVVGNGASAQEFVRHVTIEAAQDETLSDAKKVLRELMNTKGLSDDMQALALQETLQELMKEYAAPACEVNG